MTGAEPWLRPIDELNRLPGAAFAEALRPLIELAAPLASALEDARPYGSYAELLDRAQAELARLPEADQVTVLNAHPRIGDDPRRESALSAREQGSGSADVDRILAELNRAYEQRFGFRFVVFVNRRSRAEIVGVLRQRLAGPRESELPVGLREMLLIARDRLRRLQAS